MAAVILCLTGPGDLAGLRAYDAFLRLRPAPEIPSEILLVEADDSTGPAEWDGENWAEGIATLAEWGARYAVFPVAGSLDAGGKGGSSGLAKAVDEELSTIDANVATLFDAIRLGSVPPKEAPRFVAELLKTIEAGKARLLAVADGSGEVERKRLSGALRLLGRAYLAVDPLSDESGSASPPLEGARERGFASVLLDADGSKRRIALTSIRKSGGFDHPAFAALLDRLGGPALARGGLAEGGERLVLRQAMYAARTDVSIPLSRGGLLIDWPRSGSPRRLAWGELGRAARLEAELAAALDDMAGAGFLSGGGKVLIGLGEHARGLGEEALAGRASLDAWREARNRYFQRVELFLSGKAESELLAGTRARILEARTPEEADALEAKLSVISTTFAGARQTWAELARLRGRLEREIEGSFCIVAPANAAEALPPNPRGSASSEGLASAAAAGSILSRRFLKELPPYLGAALGALLALAVAVASAWLGRRWALIEGCVLVLLGVGGCLVLFLASGDYLSPIGPALGPAIASVAALFVRRAGSPAVAAPGDIAEPREVSAPATEDVTAP